MTTAASIGRTPHTFRCFLPSVILITLAVSSQASAQYGPANVEVAAVVQARVSPTTRLVGTVHPQRRAVVAAEVWGFVEAMPVDRGDLVRKGDLLCKFRDAQHQFNRNEAAARIAELNGLLDVAKSELTKAAFEHERIARLSESQRSSNKEEVDAKANFEAAKARVIQAEASVKAAQAALERAEDSLDRTAVQAPFDGFVVNKMTEIGAWVMQGGGVVEMIDLSTVRVRLNVPEALIAYNTVGIDVEISVDALDRNFAGRIARVIPDADPQARTFPIDVDIANPEHLLKAGMFVRGNVPSGPIEERLIVPRDAIVTRGAAKMIFVVKQTPEGAMADLRPVTVFADVFERSAVECPGLAVGDLVVVRGNENMFAPGPVKIVAGPAESGEPDGNAGDATSQPVANDGAESRTANPDSHTGDAKVSAGV